MRTKLAAGLGAVALVVAAGNGAAWANHGADDPAGHDANDDRGGRVATHHRHGADDGPDHDANHDRAVTTTVRTTAARVRQSATVPTTRRPTTSVTTTAGTAPTTDSSNRHRWTVEPSRAHRLGDGSDDHR